MTLTDAAAKEFRKIMERDGLDPHETAIRMGVKGGGCSGLTYTLDFDNRMTKHALVYETKDLTILVDRKSNL